MSPYVEKFHMISMTFDVFMRSVQLKVGIEASIDSDLENFSKKVERT